MASGDGPFDVERHTNTADRVLSIKKPGPAEAGKFSTPTVEMLLVRGLEADETIFYLSTEASERTAATLERATFVPLLQGSAFLDGEHTVSARAYDILGRHGPRSKYDFKVKTDGTPPELGSDRISGPLKANEGKGLYASEYGLTVTPRDGLTAGSRSGVQKAELLVDGVVKDTATASCTAAQCPHDPTLNLVLRTDQVADGERTIAVRVTDLAGNPTTSSGWPVRIDRTPPDLEVGGALVDEKASPLGAC